MFVLSLHFDRLPGQFCRLLERLAGHNIEHCSGLCAQGEAGVPVGRAIEGARHHDAPAKPQLLGCARRARQAFQWVKETRRLDGVHYGAMIDACSKSGAIDEAFRCAACFAR